MDPRLIEDDDGAPQEAGNRRKMEYMTSVVGIGIACSVDFPQDRMKIQDVIRELKSAKKVLERIIRSNM